MMLGNFSGNCFVPPTSFRGSCPSMRPVWLLMLAGLLAVGIPAQAFASPASCREMVELVDPGLLDQPEMFRQWRVRAITPREGTVELLLGKGDSVILRSDIRRAIWSKVDGRYVRPPCPFEITSRLSGTGVDAAESANLQKWLKRRLCCHPETVEAIFKAQIRLPDGQECSMIPRPRESLWQSIWGAVSRTLVHPVDLGRTSGSPWLAWLVVLLFFLALFVARTELWSALCEHPRRVWIMVLALTIVYAKRDPVDRERDPDRARHGIARELSRLGDGSRSERRAQ